MRYLILILTLVTMTACNETGGTADSAAMPVDAAPPSLIDPGIQNPVVVDPGTAPVATNVDITVYTLTRTIAPSTSYPALTFTATASCVEYSGKQDCWDDGLHATVGGPMTFSDNYFGLQTHATTGNPQSCKLTCNSSYMEPIRDVTAYRNVSMLVLGGTLGQEVDHILANGSPTLTTCTLEDDTLTCGTLVINVGQ